MISMVSVRSTKIGKAAGTERQSVLKSFIGRYMVPALLSASGIGVVTALLLALDRELATNLVPIAYLIPVMFAATRWGIWPAMVASIVGIAAVDWFFFAPLYSFRVDDPQEAVDLLLFLIVSLVSSNLASRLRKETDALRRRELEMHTLYDFSRRLAACFTIADLISAIQQYLEQTFGHPATFVVATADGQFEPPDPQFAPSEVQAGIAVMNSGIGPLSRTIVVENRKEIWLLRAISSNGAVHGVIAVHVGFGSRQTIKARTRRIEAILDETALTLHRLDIGQAMDSARLHLQGQLLRDAFHGTLSHELCSPLSAIQGSASVLESMQAVRDDPRLRTLVDGISEEVVQLDGYIKNLLNATRVTAGGLSPRLEWADPRDIIDGAIRRRSRRLAAHQVEVVFADDLALLHVDSGLIEEACGQIFENAAKYSPSGSTIMVEVRSEPKRTVVLVSDQGVGITEDDLQKLGLRSFRSARHQVSIPGSGLGFWIASTFIRANGGTVSVQSRGAGQGTIVTIRLPTPHTTNSESTALADE